MNERNDIKNEEEITEPTDTPEAEKTEKEGEAASPAQAEAQPKPKWTLERWLGEIFDVLEDFAVFSAFFVILVCFFFRPTIVNGESMEDTLHNGDYLIVREIGYTPTPGDIIVAQNISLTYHPDLLVKRVIAVSGQVVDIDFATWTLTVDGETVDESLYRKLDGALRTSDYTFPVTVPEGYVFVMGDNRNHSADSRFTEVGFIPEQCILGQAVVRLFPLGRFRLF
jgi:signal peptidase I